MLLDRNSTVFAISSGSANLPIGTWPARLSRSLTSSVDLVSSVLTNPGDSALTRIPCGARSAAADLVMPAVMHLLHGLTYCLA